MGCIDALCPSFASRWGLKRKQGKGAGSVPFDDVQPGPSKHAASAHPNLRRGRLRDGRHQAGNLDERKIFNRGKMVTEWGGTGLWSCFECFVGCNHGIFSLKSLGKYAIISLGRLEGLSAKLVTALCRYCAGSPVFILNHRTPKLSHVSSFLSMFFWRVRIYCTLLFIEISLDKNHANMQ